VGGTPEGLLTGRILKAIKKNHPLSFAFKVHGSGYQESGIPDLLICVEGLFVGLEVKAPNGSETVEQARGRATLSQQAQIIRINRANGLAGVVTSPIEALEAIQRAFRKQERVRVERLELEDQEKGD